MIQRIQSVYMLIAVVVSVVCLCMQIGTFMVDETVVTRMYNLWMTDAEGMHSLQTWPLFIVLVFSSAFGLFTIFMYRNRIVQARFCLFNALLVIGWYILYAVFAHVLAPADSSFSLSVSAVLPLVALVGYVLARRAILADEKLVRAADRIR